MKYVLVLLAVAVSTLQFTLPTTAAPVFSSPRSGVRSVPDILHLVQRKTRGQRISDCIGRARVDRDDIYEACDNALPDKKGSRQGCYSIGDMQYQNDVAACRRMQ
jgi:hypothetical protein